MNSRKSPRAPADDPDLIHSSSRNSITTNASGKPGEPAQTTLRTARLDIRWMDGDVEVRFVAHAVNMTPPNSRVRDGRTR